MIELPESLIERVRAGRCVLCLGAGLRQVAGLPSWKGVLLSLVDRLEQAGEPAERVAELRHLLEIGRPFVATGYIQRRLGDELMATEVRAQLATPVELPAALRLLGELPFRIAVTAGGDDLVERALTRPDRDPPTVVTPLDGRDLRRDARGRLVLKVLGDLARPETLAYSSKDFERTLAGAPDLRSFAEELARERSLVFLGFSSGDQDFGLLLDRLFVHAGEATEDHYAFLPDTGAIEAEELYARYRVRVLGRELAGSEPAAQIGAAVAELREAVGHLARPALDEDDLEGHLRWLAAEPDAPDVQDAVLRLEERLRTQGDWEQVAELLLGKLDLPPADGEERAHRAHTLAAVARVFEEQLGDLPRGFTALTAALREVPSEAALYDDAERLADAAGLWNELAAELADIAPAQEDRVLSARLYGRLGRIYDERLGQPDYAVSALGQAITLAAGADDTAAVIELEELLAGALRRAGRTGELVELLGRQVERADHSARRAELYTEVGQLHELAGDQDHAIEAFRRALEADDGSREPFSHLERAYRKRGSWRELVALLLRRAAIAMDPAEARTARREAAEIHAEKLADLAGAIEQLEKLAEEDPRDVGTLRLLERLYDRGGRVDAYLATLGRLADAVDTESERVIVLRRMAVEWEERDGGLERAAAALERVLQLDPRDADAPTVLERLYRRAGRWQDVIDLLRRRLATTPDAAGRRALATTIAQVYESELRDPPRAIEAWRQVEEAGGDAAAALGRLYLQTGEGERAIEALDRQAAALESSDPKRAAALLAQAAELATRTGHAPGAEERYARALAADATHVGAMIGLGALYRQRGDFLRAEKLLVEAESHSGNRLEKTRLLFEAAVLAEQHLGDETRAAGLYARVMALDPEHVEAATQLATLHERAGRYAELEPLYDVLVRKIDTKADPVRATRLLAALGSTCKRLGGNDKALRAYQRAAELDPNDAETLYGMASLLMPQDAAQAGAALERLILHHDAALVGAERREVYFQLGQARGATGHVEPAAHAFEQALIAVPGDRQVLEALAELARTHGQLERARSAKLQLADQSTGEERAKRLEEIADLEAKPDPAAAIETYEVALGTEGLPDALRRRLFHKLLDLHTTQKRWTDAVEVISKLVSLEGDAAKRGKYFYASAVISRDELGDGAAAAELFSQCLDESPDMHKAFDALVVLLQDQQDWRGLARAYRKMLKRLPQQGMEDLKLRLWNDLGEISLERLGDREAAIAALEVAESMDPDNLVRREILAALYVEAGPDRADKAISEHQHLLQREPDRLASYQALRRLYAESKQWDKMWCVCGALAFLKRADAEERRFWEERRPQRLVTAKRPLTSDLLRQCVVHPGESAYLDGIFAATASAISATTAQKHENLGLRRKDKNDPNSDPRIGAQLYRYVSETLALSPAPELFLRPEQPTAITLHVAQDKGIVVPAMVLAGGIVDKAKERELVYELARRLSLVKPERILRYALGGAERLAGALEAVLYVTGVAAQAPTDAEAQGLADQLRRTLPAPVLTQVGALASQLVSSAGEDGVDLEHWVVATDQTASRTGFLLCNDFEVAARAIAAEPQLPGGPAPKQRLKELLGYSCSEEYFTVRKYLGLEVVL